MNSPLFMRSIRDGAVGVVPRVSRCAIGPRGRVIRRKDGDSTSSVTGLPANKAAIVTEAPHHSSLSTGEVNRINVSGLAIAVDRRAFSCIRELISMANSAQRARSFAARTAPTWSHAPARRSCCSPLLYRQGWMRQPEPAYGDLRSERGTRAATSERPPAAQHASAHKVEASPAAWSDRS